ncbi:hypothetical protein K2173_027481 [Erythroxylum novogranatense]|uniref:Polysaccharide biosynthesis domain-containing protein n=1 Tax=Erythroxylum novogranatense TaxID=1862640 RepID=A0AAV8U2F0_9ROSI|nr:hypothetical protein K2173_027481 [Erythroxylum novogranatense]
MPPEVPHHRFVVAPLVTLQSPSSPEAEVHLLTGRKYFRATQGMNVPGRRYILLLVFILSTISVLRLLRLAITTSTSSSPLPALHTSQQKCSHPSPACDNVPSHRLSNLRTQHNTSANLTEMEFKLLSNLIIKKPYMKLSSINSGGITIFLEDDPEKISSIKEQFNSTRIYKVEHRIPSKEAYNLLKNARKSTACAPRSGILQNSTCKLALKNLPPEVYLLKWDVIVVDGPSGHSLEAPGRMASIYTASMIARAGNTVDVVVHDTHRTIEKWFSWEFLGDDNLVSSKGKLWNFRITGISNSTRF